jgi:hypothetical protein
MNEKRAAEHAVAKKGLVFATTHSRYLKTFLLHFFLSGDEREEGCRARGGKKGVQSTDAGSGSTERGALADADIAYLV